MNRLLIVLFSFLILPTLQAQDCNSGYMPFVEGVSMELTNYNKKDKPTTINTHTIQSVTGSGQNKVAQIATSLKDGKGKDIHSGSYEVTCTGDQIIIDMEAMMDANALSSMGSMDMTINGDGLFFPNNMDVGDELPNGVLDCKAAMGGINLMKLNIAIEDRKVLAKESITTPAGTFECLKISQSTNMKGFGNRTYLTTVWYAQGVGLVKSVNIGKKGKIESTTLLTKFTR